MTRDEFFKYADKLGRALERPDAWRMVNEMCGAYYRLTRWNEGLREDVRVARGAAERWKYWTNEIGESLLKYDKSIKLLTPGPLPWETDSEEEE